MGNADLFTMEAELVKKSKRELQNGAYKEPIEKLRLLCLSKGATGVINLSRRLRDSKSENNALNLEGLKTALRDVDLNCSESEVTDIFQKFDTEGQGTINVPEFIKAVRPSMPANRTTIIEKAFSKMDTHGQGSITLKELKGVYNVKQNPKYKSGEMSADEISKNFMRNFEGKSGSQDGSLTREEFIEYYSAISASVDQDIYFDLMMRQDYKL